MHPKLFLQLQRAWFFAANVLFKPIRLFNFVKFVLGRRGFGQQLRLNYVPYRLDVEPTTHCNFRCSICHVSNPDWQGKHMEFDGFKTLVDRNPEVFKIKLQGMGEPFINKQFLDMAKYAASKGVYVTTTTNGSALTKGNVEKLLSGEGLREIIVSLDGATKGTFEAIRPGADFDAICENSRRLIEANARLPRSRRVFVAAWTVLQRRNMREAQDIIELAADIGFNRLTFQVTISDWGKTEWSANKGEQIHQSEEDASALALFAKSKGLWFQYYRENALEPGTPCSWPFESVYVGSGMEAVPCCSVADASVANLGSLQGNSILEIWNSDEYLKLRQAHLSGKPPGYCSQCYKN